MSSQRKRPLGGGRRKYITEYRHYRTGKVMRASDYGYKAWPFGKGRRKGK